MRLEFSARQRDGGALLRASLRVALLLALLGIAGCTQPAVSRGAVGPASTPESTMATDAAPPTPGSSQVEGKVAELASAQSSHVAGGTSASVVRASAASPPQTTAVVARGRIQAPQAHGSWPPFCLALNYHLYGFQQALPLHEPRGVQTELQWHPAESEVLFASGDEVYSVAADGSRLERLIDLSGPTYPDQSRYTTQSITGAAISPDGERLVYAVCREYSPDWKNPADPHVARCTPRWSDFHPHNRSSCLSRPSPVIRDYVAGPVFIALGSAFAEIRLWDHAKQSSIPLAAGYAPALSPDGRRLAFLSDYDDASAVLGYRSLRLLVVMTLDGRDVRRVASGEITGAPRWSPDGRRLAFVENGELSVVEVDGPGSWRLGKNRSDPAWSPDGSRIAFLLGGRRSVGLYTISPDGTDERRITTVAVGGGSRDGWEQSVAWSPDSTMLLYRCGGICVVTRDGQPVGLPEFAARSGYSAAWSPDGARIAILTVDGTRGDDRVLVTTTVHGVEPQVLVVHDDEHGLLGIGVDGDSEPVDASGCASGTAVPAPAANRGLVRDCQVLLQARPVLEGSLEGALNWHPERPITEWDGVVVGGTPPRVQALSLGWPVINGRIPSALAGLTHLRELELRGYLGGELPPDLGELKNLRALRLSAAYIHGPIPPELGQLAQLEGLMFLHTYLSGSIPPELAGLRWLRSLWIADSPFLVGSIPPELGRLASLEGLGLSNNGLTGSIPAELGQLTKLGGLSLEGNQLTGPIPLELDALTKLEHLELGGNQLTGCVPPGLRDRLGLPDCETAA